MPELPEVHTTVTGLSKTIVGHTITDVWTDYNSPYFKGSNTIKDPAYFKYFRKEILGKKIISVSRRAKNILINLKPDKSAPEKTILIHMKMTGHVMVGRYVYRKNKRDVKSDSHLPSGIWLPASDERKSLHDPYNRFIHFVITLSNGQQLVLSDTRKFAKVTLLTNDAMTQLPNEQSEHLKDLGPEPLDKNFTFEVFKNQINKKPNGKIKTVLMDQSLISGIGNIYSDEALWRAGIHPETQVRNIPMEILKKLYSEALTVLKKGIDFGGDSMSDYRNVHGERGKFQEQHQVYRKKGEKCSFGTDSQHKGKPCKGIIQRKVVNGRSAHFCPVHQKLF
jgi:formamidopyrimidine-DNA glycosylase